ncbi:hypothetical protein [Corynebacterium sp.]|uniref:AMIN-like domain-containing (lipo)protein n=1 Tax=Corynebacterium sp. TaxID=1720 RepID=UPI0026DF14C5|nr:hypothetical protein [Corynebacterium sp.]MDO5513489.1 hypothetical protein [Corynebacterium sp.]
MRRLLLMVPLALAACGSPAPEPVAVPSTVTSPEITALGAPGTDRQEHWPILGQLHVTDYRIGEHEGFDRLVFDLEGEGEPGWFIEYTDEPLQQASGLPVDVEGTTALQVIIMGTPYPPEGEDVLLPAGRHPGGGVINHVTYASLFEANSEFVIGLNARHPYSVTFLEDPKRLVIDLVKR